LLAAAKNALKVSALAVAASALPGVASAAGDFSLNPYWPYVAVNILVFGLLIYPVNRLLVQPLLHVLDERAAKTTGALDRVSALENETRDLDKGAARKAEYGDVGHWVLQAAAGSGTRSEKRAFRHKLSAR
jgi:hypothetical protein